MALAKMAQQWDGVQRAISNCKLETCYSVYVDTYGGNELPQLRIAGLSIYADTATALQAVLPATVRIDIGNSTYTYHIDSTVSNGAYSPSGNWMQYYASLTSQTYMDMPAASGTFNIGVTVTAQNGTALQFTETAHKPLQNSITPPSQMVTGRAHAFTFSEPVNAGGNYTSSAVLTWRQESNAVLTEVGFVDPYTKVSETSSAFSAVYFAVPNQIIYIGPSSISQISSATVNVRTYYQSSDFTNGCLIMDTTCSTQIQPREEVDASLAPVITGITMSADPAEAIVNGKYVHKRATVTFTPSVRFQYGDTLASLYTNASGSRYAVSASLPAEGVTPGETYVRPDTGVEEIAGDTTVRGLTMNVTGNKWKLTSSDYSVYYNVLYYHEPKFLYFNIYRMSVSQITTQWYYNGTYYKKDDYGAYCLIDYQASFSDLDGQNDPSLVVQYATHRIAAPMDAAGCGFVVVPANTSVSIDILGMLYDVYVPYGVVAKRRLSTGMILLDYLNGGKGMAVGKAATAQNTLDIADGWQLLFYQATVGAYSGSSEQDLVAWMHDIDDRLTALENGTTAN